MIVTVVLAGQELAGLCQVEPAPDGEARRVERQVVGDAHVATAGELDA